MAQRLAIPLGGKDIDATNIDRVMLRIVAKANRHNVQVALFIFSSGVAVPLDGILPGNWFVLDIALR